MARLDGEARQVRLLVDHREDLIGERTRQVCRLRWHLYELDPAWDPPLRSLNRYKQLDQIIARLADFDGPIARLALELATSVRAVTVRITPAPHHCQHGHETRDATASPAPGTDN